MRNYASCLFGIVIYQDDIETYSEKEDMDIFEICSNDENLTHIDDEWEWDAIALSDEGYEFEKTGVIAFGQLKRGPSLTEKAYDSLDAAAEAAKEQFGYLLPEDFPYIRRLAQFLGVSFG